MTLRCLSLHRKERQDVLFTSSVMVPINPILAFILLHHIAVFKQCEILLLHSRTRSVSCCFLIILSLSCLPNSLILGLLLNSIKIMNKKIPGKLYNALPKQTFYQNEKSLSYDHVFFVQYCIPRALHNVWKRKVQQQIWIELDCFFTSNYIQINNVYLNNNFDSLQMLGR